MHRDPAAAHSGFRVQAFHDQPFTRSIGFRYQVELALQLESDFSLGELVDQRAGFARDLGRGFEKGGHALLDDRARAPLGGVRNLRPSDRDGSRSHAASYRYLMSCLKMNRFGAPVRVTRMKR